VAPVQATGDPAWSDGTTVFVDLGADPLERLRSLVVQAALVGAGSLEADLLAALARRPALARRYLAVEGRRALAVHGFVLPLALHPFVDQAEAGRSDSPAASLTIARGRAVIADPPPWFGTVRPGRTGGPGRTADPSASGEHVPRRSRGVLSELDDEGGTGPTIDLTSPIGGGGGIGRLLKRLFGEGRSAGGGPAGADAPTRWARDAGSGGGSRSVSTTAMAVPDATAIVVQRGATYPEWDARRHRYRPDWCTVTEIDPAPGHQAVVPAPHSVALRRPLARLGMELEQRHRELQGVEIDLDAAVEERVAVLAGSVPDEAVYIDAVRRRRDLAVLLLLDVSGSAGEPSVAGGTVHAHQLGAAASLVSVLHGLGDRVALYGFRSQGRSAVHLLRVKRFGDELDATALRRLGALVPGGYTRLGAAVRHGAAIVDRDAGTPRRLVVVLSDGFAYDHGYERDYGEADTRHALAEARRRGTGCLCLSIAAGVDAEALRRVFGTAAHASIPRVDDLPGVVGPLFRSALRSAEVQRRAWQRRARTTERLLLERRTA
jgi:Mg-chelatase subunit ChlD